MPEKHVTDKDLDNYEEEPLQAAAARSQVFSIRLAADELRTIANEARLVHMTVGAFIKTAALNAAATHRLSQSMTMEFGFQSSGLGIRGVEGTRPSVEGAPAQVSIDGNAYQTTATAA